MKRFNKERACGMVMPIFSLDSPYGIGTMGESAYRFVDFLKESGISYWQILPLGHTGFGNSPYQTYSVVAGNPFLIDWDSLVELGLIPKSTLNGLERPVGQIDYDEIKVNSKKVLTAAFNHSNNHLRKDILHWTGLEAKDWVFDYAFFMALKDYFDEKPVWEWEDSIKKREPEAVQKYKIQLKESIDFYIFVQFIFFHQWKRLKEYANSKGISIIGDIPMYPAPDSVDVWINRKYFMVDENLLPTGIAGVPPDLYSETGQLWGNPTYNWQALKESNYEWWISRIKHTLSISDIIRIDHFRAFSEYWEIPQGEETALNGKWLPGPRMDIFNSIHKALGDVPFIAEDLGLIDDKVRSLLKESGYPGMRVMIFSFSANEESSYLTHNWEKNSVGYVSTHDSETIVECLTSRLNETDREFAFEYLNIPKRNQTNKTLALKAIRASMASHANTCMFMAGDALGLGIEGRINIPGTIGANWAWRATPGSFTNELAKELYNMAKTYKRI